MAELGGTQLRARTFALAVLPKGAQPQPFAPQRRHILRLKKRDASFLGAIRQGPLPAMNADPSSAHETQTERENTGGLRRMVRADERLKEECSGAVTLPVLISPC